MYKMDICRTKFANGIIADFAVPARRRTRKVVLFCDGVPSVPCKKSLMEFFAEKGFWVFHVRYRGTWESGGVFLKFPPHKDILDVINILPKGFEDLWSGNKYKLEPEPAYLIGSSFGGAVVMLASMDKRVAKAVAVSPVVDWHVQGKGEPHSKWQSIVRKGFGNVYRSNTKKWIELLQSDAYNPIAHRAEADGSKIFIIHAQDDTIAPAKHAVGFAKNIGAKLKLYKRGGHFSTSVILKKPALARAVLAFFKE